jgi:serine protease Do
LVIQAPLAASAGTVETPQSREQLRLSFAPVVRQAAPAVVNIYSRKRVETRGLPPLFDDPLFRRFFGEGTPFGAPQTRVQNSLGSGVIVDATGIIVTNDHVVAGAEEITVVLADRREFDARIIGADDRTDLAVLRVEAGRDLLPALPIGDSDDVQVGDLVLAIGNPFGVGQTVTSGIVSALARTRVGIADLNFFIQTDAAINPGNSGGALVDLSGQLIGINTAIYSNTGGSLGIGFAVPSNMVRSVVAGLTGVGRLVRPWFGAWGQRVSAEMSATLGMERPAGVIIEDVYPGGPAERAGIRVGDVVLAVGGHSIDDEDGLNYRIATLTVGSETDVTLWRRGRETSIAMIASAPPETPPREATELSGQQPFAGATVANLSPALAEELGRHRFRPGVVIVSLRPASTAKRLGLRVGDQILTVNGKLVTSVAALKSVTAKRAQRWEVTLQRDGQTLSLVVGG